MILLNREPQFNCPNDSECTQITREEPYPPVPLALGGHPAVMTIGHLSSRDFKEWCGCPNTVTPARN